MANPAPIPPVRPPRIDGDWTDDRTPADELYFPSIAGVNIVRRSAQAPTNVGRSVRGTENQTPITYGNRLTQVTAFLNSKDPTPPPMTRMANKMLPHVNRPMAAVLVDIIDFFHYLAVSTILSTILNNKAICGKNARPKEHLTTAKTNIIAQLIKIFTYGRDCGSPSLVVAVEDIQCPISKEFTKHACFHNSASTSSNFSTNWTSA